MSKLHSDIDVCGYFRFLNNDEEYFELKSEYDYQDIINALCKDIVIDLKSVYLSKIDMLGWHIDVVPNSKQHDVEIGIIDIQDKDTLCINKIRETIGPRKYLRSLMCSYRNKKQNMQLISTRVDEMMQNYCGWRAVKGDGNCYYRAVYFSLFEQLIVNRQNDLFLKLIERFDTIEYLDRSENDDHIELLEMLESAAGGVVWTTVAELECDVLSSDSVIDEACIRACRKLVTRYILEHQNSVVNGITIKESIMPSYEDVKTMEEYCAKYVDKMGIDAEGPFVNIGLLLLALNCKGTIVYLDGREDVELTMINSGSVGGEVFGDVHLLLRPGHYDMLYPYDLYDIIPSLSRQQRHSLIQVATPSPHKSKSGGDETAGSRKGLDDISVIQSKPEDTPIRMELEFLQSPKGVIVGNGVGSDSTSDHISLVDQDNEHSETTRNAISNQESASGESTARKSAHHRLNNLVKLGTRLESKSKPVRGPVNLQDQMLKVLLPQSRDELRLSARERTSIRMHSASAPDFFEDANEIEDNDVEGGAGAAARNSSNVAKPNGGVLLYEKNSRLPVNSYLKSNNGAKGIPTRQQQMLQKQQRLCLRNGEPKVDTKEKLTVPSALEGLPKVSDVDAEAPANGTVTDTTNSNVATSESVPITSLKELNNSDDASEGGTALYLRLLQLAPTMTEAEAKSLISLFDTVEEALVYYTDNMVPKAATIASTEPDPQRFHNNMKDRRNSSPSQNLVKLSVDCEEQQIAKVNEDVTVVLPPEPSSTSEYLQKDAGELTAEDLPEEMLPLLDVGLSVSSISQAMLVGQCTTFEEVLEFEKRKTMHLVRMAKAKKKHEEAKKKDRTVDNDKQCASSSELQVPVAPSRETSALKHEGSHRRVGFDEDAVVRARESGKLQRRGTGVAGAQRAGRSPTSGRGERPHIRMQQSTSRLNAHELSQLNAEQQHLLFMQHEQRIQKEQSQMAKVSTAGNSSDGAESISSYEYNMSSALNNSHSILPPPLNEAQRIIYKRIRQIDPKLPKEVCVDICRCFFTLEAFDNYLLVHHGVIDPSIISKLQASPAPGSPNAGQDNRPQLHPSHAHRAPDGHPSPNHPRGENIQGRLRNRALLVNSKSKSGRINGNSNGSSRRLMGDVLVNHAEYAQGSSRKTLTEQQKKIMAKLVSMVDPMTGKPVIMESEARELALQFKSIDEFCDFAQEISRKSDQTRPGLAPRQKSDRKLPNSQSTRAFEPPVNPTQVASSIASVAFSSLASFVMPRRNTTKASASKEDGAERSPKNWFAELAEEDDETDAEVGRGGAASLALTHDSDANRRRNMQFSSWNRYLSCFKPTADQMRTW